MGTVLTRCRCGNLAMHATHGLCPKCVISLVDGIEAATGVRAGIVARFERSEQDLLYRQELRQKRPTRSWRDHLSAVRHSVHQWREE